MAPKNYNHILVVAVLCLSALAAPVSARLFKGRIQKRLAQIRDLIGDINDDDGALTFPDSVEGDVDISGRGLRHFLGQRVENVRPPIVEERSRHRPAGRKQRMELKDTAFYTGPDGSFACKAKTVMGKKKCEIVGLLHDYDNDENCLIIRDRAICLKVQPGEELVLDPSTDRPLEKRSITDKLRPLTQGRFKRQVTEPFNTSSVISVALYLDKSIMDRFKEINNGDYAQAILDAEEYCVLLGNEWTYRYQTIKQYSGWSTGFDMAVNVVEIVYPPEGEDFSFMRYTSDGETDVQSVVEFYQDAEVSALFSGDNAIAHHVMLITGNELSIIGKIGMAYFGTICNSDAERASKRVSIQRDLDYNVAHVGAHEIAHALGAYHDGSSESDLSSSCDPQSNIMSSSVNGVTSETKNTYYTFSRCTSDQFLVYLTINGNCLHSMSSDFLDNFCLGHRGQFGATSLNTQCERSFGSGWATCDATKTTLEAWECWYQWAVQCCLNGDQTISNRKMIQLVYDGTPCVGADPSKPHYCYLGNCTEGNTICGSTLPPEPTAAPTTGPTPAPTQSPPASTAAPTVTTAPTDLDNNGTCECTQFLCSEWSCFRGNKACCNTWISDMLLAISEFSDSLNE